MTDEPEFLRRWSRRKRAARKAKADAPPTEDADEARLDEAPPPADVDAAGQSESGTTDEEAVDLPDIDSLTTDSDFTPFLKPGVPKELKNRALRILWRVNPVFSQLDGLNDYDGDFTDAASVVKDLKTLYKVGRGFLPDSPDEPSEAVADDSEAEDADKAAAADQEVDRQKAENPGTDGQGGNKIS